MKMAAGLLLFTVFTQLNMVKADDQTNSSKIYTKCTLEGVDKINPALVIDTRSREDFKRLLSEHGTDQVEIFIKDFETEDYSGWIEVTNYDEYASVGYQIKSLKDNLVTSSGSFDVSKSAAIKSDKKQDSFEKGEYHFIQLRCSHHSSRDW